MHLLPWRSIQWVASIPGSGKFRLHASGGSVAEVMIFGSILTTLSLHAPHLRNCMKFTWRYSSVRDPYLADILYIFHPAEKQYNLSGWFCRAKWYLCIIQNNALEDHNGDLYRFLNILKHFGSVDHQINWWWIPLDFAVWMKNGGACEY